MNYSECPILLVEDDPYDLLLFQRAFRKSKIDCPLEVVRDGETVLQYLMGEGIYADRDRYPLPILMLLDLKMPRKSGFEVLEWLKEQPQLKRLLVVVLTSSQEVTDINRAYELGANSYLVKPSTLDALHDLIKTLNFYWIKLNQIPEIDCRRNW